ncbi:MAG: HAD family hydrolase [Methanobacteriota archaeon]|nr:MAG: HAD family hydrolase [Euryarchaeota archaeon]
MDGIEAVTFDLWDTLIQEVPGGSARVARLRIDEIAEILGSAGLAFSTKDVEAAYSDTGRDLERLWSEWKDVTVSCQVESLLRRLDDELPEALARDVLDRVLEVYSESMLEHPPKLLPGAREALSEVRGMVPRQGLISNTGKTPGRVLRTLMERFDILRYFDATTFSDETLARKPAPEIFVRTLSALGVPSARAVHIGDDPLADVGGAKGVGMRAIQVGRRASAGDQQADARAESLADVAGALRSLSAR